ncbi:MAG TPA: Eco29kI family restriction endonuclease [Bryobacteraceae bacterium]|nr:Eco29kI family restriction endonuclease [Bryobacteraceae bacterium]
MRSEPPYNPLDKRNLGVSVADALLAKALGPLPPEEPFIGAGVYAIYYAGGFPGYKSISLKSKPQRETPIYVGKAVPAGARKGGFGLDVAPGTVLYNRLAEHADSIRQVKNLEIADFLCRYLVVDDIWIPLGESLLIQTFSPVWNRLIDGFGNHDPGKGRHQGQMPSWDVLHPGRGWAGRLQPNKRLADELLAVIGDFFRSQPKSK